MIYKFVIISGEEESFVREFELDENNTLLDFHKAIVEELEYDETQIASFFTTNKRWEKEEEFTLFEMGSDTTVMNDVIIDDIVLEVNQKLLYVFDMFNERTLFIESIGVVDEIDGRKYPICTQSSGKPPQQIIMNGFSPAGFSSTSDEDDDLLVDSESDIPDFDSIDDMEE